MPIPPRAALPPSGRLAAVLRATMAVASFLAIVRGMLVLYVGWCFCQSIIPAYATEPELPSVLAEGVGAMLALAAPIVIGVFLTYAAYAGLNARPHALRMLRVGYAAGLLDALVWAGVGLYYGVDVLDTVQEDPSVGLCVLPTLGVAGIRALVSVVAIGFYVTAWLTVEQPQHRAWLSGAPRSTG